MQQPPGAKARGPGNVVGVSATIDFHEFNTVTLPQRLAAGNGALAGPDATEIGPLAIATPAGVYTYRGTGDGIEVVAGDDLAKTVVAVDLDSWRGLVTDLETPPSLFYSGRLDVVRGNPLRFVRWEPALRAMFHGRPIYDAARVDLRDRSGAPLELSRSFTVDEVRADAADASHFLRTAGYLWVRDAFSDTEVDEMLVEAAVLYAEAREGDQESWWGKTDRGEPVLCRVLTGARRPRLQELHGDERVNLVASLPATELRNEAGNGRDGITVLWKSPNVAEGLADLPWHRDCGMGGHAVKCPSYVMTICLTEGSPAAGELKFLPGSQHTSHPFIDGREESAPEGVSIPVTAGDMTIHIGDVMHVSMPPTSVDGPHRVSILMGFAPPDARHHRGERHYNDALLGAEDGQVPHLKNLV